MRIRTFLLGLCIGSLSACATPQTYGVENLEGAFATPSMWFIKCPPGTRTMAKLKVDRKAAGYACCRGKRCGLVGLDSEKPEGFPY